MKKLIAGIVFFSAIVLNAQDQNLGSYQNSAEKILNSRTNFTIGGYSEINYNQTFGNEMYNEGELDVQRLVLLFGYQFNERTRFITEIEFEHVKEVYVEQAFLQYKLNDFINFRGGLLLIPMGLTNEFHEPPVYFGVERPLIDKTISPTTWREIGLGFTGNILPASLKYQVYIVNGFKSYSTEGLLNGKDGFRKGRQKGAESVFTTPNFTAKIEYYGFAGLSFGLSAYAGKSQSTLYDGISKDNSSAIAIADSSIVGLNMLGVDARYNINGVKLKTQLYLANITNTEQYNAMTSNDLGSAMTGYYLEAGYNILNFLQTDVEFTPFIRFSQYNTHAKVDANLEENSAYNKKVITTGIDLKLARGAVLKTDIQFLGSQDDNTYSKVFNAGIGIMF